ncbi:MAG: M23 family metallopeptidase [Spirochaetota bacterium]|nr:M23 family metallopeptidase [Spirochaetota bacterium]
MRKRYSKTYRIRNFCVSFLLHEVTLLYSGKKRIYVKTISWNNSLLTRKRIIVISTFVLLSIFLILASYKIRDSDELWTDEEKKNKLLLSHNTDYSTPESITPLQIRFHKVKRGETLSEIAQENGVSMDTICGTNCLNSYDIIREGAILRIPNKDGILHRVKKGQNIIYIANKYKISIDKILSENSIKNYDFISIGEDIFVPDAKPLNIIPGFLWPAQTKYITSGYGWRRHPINRRRHFHLGIDIRSKYQWVRATKYGKVTFTGWLGGYGRVVVIAHPGGWKSLYGHLSRSIVRKGQYVKQGQFIARSGNTGYSSGPHLHFELLKKGKHINPYKYLR